MFRSLSNHISNRRTSRTNREKKEFHQSSHRKRWYHTIHVLFEAPELGIEQEPGSIVEMGDVYQSHRDRFYIIRLF